MKNQVESPKRGDSPHRLRGLFCVEAGKLIGHGEEMKHAHQLFVNHLKDSVLPYLFSAAKWKRKRLDTLKESVVSIEDYSLLSRKERESVMKRWAESLNHEKNNFLLYKIDEEWFIHGIDILGRPLERSVNDFVEHEQHYRVELEKIICQSAIQDISDEQKNKLKEIIVDYFGHSRILMFFSYVWASPQDSKDYSNDLLNQLLVHRIATDLEAAGIRVLLDKWYIRSGTKINDFIKKIEVVDNIAIF
jgi:hypothetical protein